MKIFISWSGQRSQALASALSDWLRLVLHYAEPWVSTSDIKPGERWSIEVAKGLQESKFGIVCVTKDNLEAPWLLFESGALAKSMEDGRVIPVRLDLDVSDITGPLAQFQSEKADIDGMRRLVTNLNKVSSVPIIDTTLTQLFDLAWCRLEEKVLAIPTSGAPQKKSRSQSDILEELVSGVRSVEMRVRDMHEENLPLRRGIRRRVHPGMMMDMARHVGGESGGAVQILVFGSFFKDDAPWLYELAIDAYRALSAGNGSKAEKAYHRFRNALEAIRRGPFLDLMGIDSKMIHVLLMEYSDYLPSYPVNDSGFGEVFNATRRTKPAVPSKT